MNPDHPIPSPTTYVVADPCFKAAQSILNIMCSLWNQRSIATYGYFDSHYLLSASLVFRMATMINYSNTHDIARTSYDTASSLLQRLKDVGNIAARECYDVLIQVELSLGGFQRPSEERLVDQQPPPDNNHLDDFLHKDFAQFNAGSTLPGSMNVDPFIFDSRLLDLELDLSWLR